MIFVSDSIGNNILQEVVMKKMLKNLVASLLVLALVFSGVAFSAETKVSASAKMLAI